MTIFGDSSVSVCTPVYNGGDYIEQTIRSILAQTYENFQLIVCDNCSTDNTEEIVRSFKDPRIFYNRNERNLGLVGNANRCLELAEGDYVHILHHDDIMRAGQFGTQGPCFGPTIQRWGSCTPMWASLTRKATGFI